MAVAVGLAVVLAGIGIGLALSSDIRLVGPGAEAPDFYAFDVRAGDTLRFRDAYVGDVVLLNVWATWCPACEEEMPSMQRLYEQLGPEGLKVVAVSIDKAAPGFVLRWVEERDLTFDILQDRAGRIEQIYQTTGVPESFVIDRDGVIVKKEIGAAEWDHPARVALFRHLLELSASDSDARQP
ncbi:MAG: TlpA disulfide reductase family protein, partial [Gemmatimonadales bacterium]